MFFTFIFSALPKMRNPHLAERGIKNQRNAEWFRYLPYLKNGITQKCTVIGI
jgi:hypothetical protein